MIDFDIPIASLQQAFPQFVKIEEVATGGQKAVYRAEKASRDQFALKIIKSDITPNHK